MEKSKNEEDLSFSYLVMFSTFPFEDHFLYLNNKKEIKQQLSGYTFSAICQHYIIFFLQTQLCFVLAELFFYPQLQLVCTLSFLSFPSICVLVVHISIISIYHNRAHSLQPHVVSLVFSSSTALCVVVISYHPFPQPHQPKDKMESYNSNKQCFFLIFTPTLLRDLQLFLKVSSNCLYEAYR